MRYYRMPKEEYETKKGQLAALESEMDACKIAYGKYLTASNKASKLREELYDADAYNEMQAAELATKYKECEFPDIGVIGRKGEAWFENKAASERLMKTLRGGWETVYRIEWTDAGWYDLIPTREYSRGDNLYVGTFKRREPNEPIYVEVDDELA